MRREAKHPRPDGERFDRQAPNSTGLSMRYCRFGRGEFVRRRTRFELRRDLPFCARGRLERRRGGPIVETARPHDRCRHVDVRVGGVDGQIRAVDPIAIDLVFDRHDARVHRHAPAGIVRLLDSKLPAICGVRIHVVDVLCEIVQRISSWRRPADRGARGGHAARPLKCRLDLHPAPRGPREN